MALNDVYKCTIIGHNDQAPVVLVLHYRTRLSIGDKALEMEYLAKALDEVLFKKTIVNDMLNFCHQSVIFDEIKVRDVNNPTLGYDLLLEAPNGGNLTGNQLPQQNAMLLRKGTGLIGKSFRGRNYFPFGNTGSLDSSGQWGALFLANALDWFVSIAYILDPVLGTNFQWELVIYSEKLLVTNTVTTFSAIDDPRTQRRRAY